ncbi:thioredoxin domain-containing protein [Patescibacteria group bacterium AH-259-L05]|nr:thioredoxin domain-containing protein [Patescibacteria group bacterium AH-259-L05]
MPNFKRNNLDSAVSPYLRQHKDNPIHWQEWDKETLDYAKKTNKLLFVSIGYATCHWCHVMASEAFSNAEIADILNKYFVSIKVDREQRPDLDQYFMEFATQTTGSGGWPLNVILSSGQKPFFAGTYFPVESQHGLLSFRDVLVRVLGWYKENKNNISEFRMGERKVKEGERTIDELIVEIGHAFDRTYGGFGQSTKFPPHNALLFLMSYYGATGDDTVASLITQTLDTMAMRGLHDHLQGGFFRYCVDRQWSIPHFEKMLYDQAMHLMSYSMAYKLFNRTAYKRVVDMLILCLEQTFEHNGLLYSAHDADTDHEEGTTYLWSYQELQDVLTNAEFEKLRALYTVTQYGNFEGRNHLIKKEHKCLDTIENKLLGARKKRPQPFVDKKIVTSWNALAGIGLILAFRWTSHRSAKQKAIKLFDKLIREHFRDGKLAHSSCKGSVQEQEFLEDYASVLLLATYIYEEIGEGKEIIETLLTKLESFRCQGQWFMNRAGGDFKRIPARPFDHPTPSGISLGELARFRAHRILQRVASDETKIRFKQHLENDFYNLVVFLQRGNYHELHTPHKLLWKDVPINSMQLKGTFYQDCYQYQCRQFKTKKELLSSLRTS